MKIAVLDLGTNTFHLLIVESRDRNKWKRIHNERVTVKLGQGGIGNKVIAPQPFKRGVKAIEKFHREIKERGITRVFAFGTAALRNAANGKAFVKLVRQHFGISIKLISGEKEAELIYYGVRQAVDLSGSPSLIMDIGGGSVEFIIADHKRILWKQSFPAGAALLIDTFSISDPIKKTEIKVINDHLSELLSPLAGAVQHYKPERIIGSAGSFGTFASMIHAMFPDTGSHYNHTEFPIHIPHFRKLYQQLIVSDTSTRKKMRGLIKMRVDMIVPAAILLNFVLKMSEIERLVLSSYALKEGAVYEVLRKNVS